MITEIQNIVTALLHSNFVVALARERRHNICGVL